MAQAKSIQAKVHPDHWQPLGTGAKTQLKKRTKNGNERMTQQSL
jgi:hypothetical protein